MYSDNFFLFSAELIFKLPSLLNSSCNSCAFLFKSLTSPLYSSFSLPYNSSLRISSISLISASRSIMSLSFPIACFKSLICLRIGSTSFLAFSFAFPAPGASIISCPFDNQNLNY